MAWSDEARAAAAAARRKHSGGSHPSNAGATESSGHGLMKSRPGKHTSLTDVFTPSLAKFGGDPHSKFKGMLPDAQGSIDKNSPFARSLANYHGVSKVVTKDPMSPKQVAAHFQGVRAAHVKALKKRMKKD